jgi:hypothetical protein
VLSSPKLFCDDTRLPVLAPGKGKTSTGYPVLCSSRHQSRENTK